MKSGKSRLLTTFLEILQGAGLFEIVRLLSPNTLTVLNYHRIDDIHRPGFDTFKPNVSATQGEFAKQMDYVQKRFNVITCGHLASWLRGETSLPPRAAIITFDDGYYDNFSNAYPVLKERGLSAVIFLTTDFMGSDAPFYWDFVAYCFAHTKKDQAHLPLTGTCSWIDEPTRHKAMIQWIEALKRLPEDQKRGLIQNIASVLEVTIPAGAFSGLYLNGDQVREMSRNGIEFGSHTVTHPILTRIPLDQVARELAESKRKIESEIGKPVISFAYPNGQPSDFSDDVMKIVRNAGMEVAFTLLPGPTRYSSVRRNPMAIRRIFLGNSDTFPRFAAKLAGMARLVNWL